MDAAVGTIGAEETAAGTVVRLTGEIDGALRQQADAAVAVAVAAARPVVLDAAGIRFIDSTGIAFLVRCATACTRAGLDVRLLDPPDHLVALLRMLGLDGLLLPAR